MKLAIRTPAAPPRGGSDGAPITVRRWRILPLISIALIVSHAATKAAPADPQPQPNPPTPSTASASSKTGLPEVVIEANREALERRVRTFVTTLTHSRRFPDPGQPAPRWMQPLCFEVAGLPRKYAEFVATQLVHIAASVGADVRKECARPQANFEIVFTPNPADTLRYASQHPLLLQERPETSLSQIERFLSPPKSVVVRVWHSTEVLDAYGAPCGFSLLVPGVLSCGDNSGGSRIHVVSAAAFARTIVVVDSTRIQGIQLGQISAYVAMVGLADVDDDVDVGDAPSILRLFGDPSDKRVEGLTEWDRAFLSALYHTNWRNAQQRVLIGDKMAKGIAR